jgi:hypothetical protein
MDKKTAAVLLLSAGSLFSQEAQNVLSISVPVLTVRGGDGETQFYINDRAFVVYDRSITNLISLNGRVRLSAFPIGANRTGTIFDAGVGMRFWFSGKFSGLFLGPHATFEIADYGRTSTSFIIGGEAGYRIIMGDVLSFSLSGGPEVRFGDGPSLIGLSGYISVGYAF